MARHFLKEWRKFRGLTQQALADATGHTKGYISNIERGESRYNEDVLEALAGALGCESWQLLGQNPLVGRIERDAIVARHYIKEWREHRKMTQEQAAAASGVSQSTLTRIETGAREYKEHHLEALARIYACTPAQLIGEHPISPKPNADIVDIWDHILARLRD